MSDIAEVVSDLFGLDKQGAKTMVLGATLIDTDTERGYTSKGQMAQHRNQSMTVASPVDALAFYPLIEDTEKENRDNETDMMLALAATWFNCFVPCTRGLPGPDYACKATVAHMSNNGVVTTDQVFKARKDEMLNCLFTAFKYFNGKDDDDRLVPQELQDDEAMGKLIRKGMVDPAWFVAPLGVRYVVCDRGDTDSDDYVYLVGGSPELFQTDMDSLADELWSDFQKMKNYFEEAQQQGTPNEISRCDELVDRSKVWWKFDSGSYSDSLVEHPYTRAHLLSRKINRTIQGVFLIRNYFVYAQKYVGVETVAEFDMANGPDPVKVPIQTVIDRYQRIYKYCRNLCAAYPEIGQNNLDR